MFEGKMNVSSDTSTQEKVKSNELSGLNVAANKNTIGSLAIALLGVMHFFY